MGAGVGGAETVCQKQMRDDMYWILFLDMTAEDHQEQH